MTIVNMLRFERAGVQQCRLLGSTLGSIYIFFGTKSGQEPSQSDRDTISVDLLT